MTRRDSDPAVPEPPSVLHRREALKLLAGVGVVTVAAACGSSGSSSSSPSTTSRRTDSTTGTSATTEPTQAAASTEPIPEETAGPFPGDGTNGPNALDQDGVVRGDIRSSFAGATGTADGVPTTLSMTIVDSASGGAIAGAAVYVWHCDREGRYSMYSDGATDANYLRGVQESDEDGAVTFTSIFPGAYPGRWPHIHFEVYSSIVDATSAGTPIATSQLAFPEDACNLVYATEGYEASVATMQQTSLADDMVFADGVDAQMATIDGTVDSGLAATLRVPV